MCSAWYQMCATLNIRSEISQLCVVATQVQVQDPDEAENGAVTLVLQMGVPRLEFRLNTSTGELFSTAALDRERISQYHLRLVAFDAGQFPRTSTSTLTITGTNQIKNQILSVTAGEDISSSNTVHSHYHYSDFILLTLV